MTRRSERTASSSSVAWIPSSFQAPESNSRTGVEPKLPSDNITLADPGGVSGPVSTMKERLSAPVWFPERPCNLFPHVPVEAAKSRRAGHYAVPLGAPGHWCDRAFNRDGDGCHEERHILELFPRCGRAGEGVDTGFWDVAQTQHSAQHRCADKLPCWTFPLAGPEWPVSFPRGSIRGAGDA